MANTLKQRLLRDIAELQSKPYPNIELHVQDDDLTKACLILTVEGYGPMHLTVTFPSNYPLAPPRIQMDSDVVHPNIFDTYICASILNTTEGYTPAYTLKGIAIQLLSFFGSDKIEQVGGGYSVDLDRNKIRDDVRMSLSSISSAANLGAVPPVEVIYHFMNDIVVKLNTQTSEATTRSPHYPHEEASTGTMNRASEKAIESYFHCFHLLLCMATTQPAIVQSANALLRGFGQGKSSKTECPNLGTLLVAALVSDVEMSDGMIKSIVKETITRNVVWMLDSKGANMPELAYLEPSAVSNYRLQKTFEASKTSYRLLMFLNLFRKTAVGNPRKPLIQLRDEAFERHGAPPRGAAKGLAQSIKRIGTISNFPQFLVAMDIGQGYSRMPFSQGHALALRQRKEPGVEVAEGVYALDNVDISRASFFLGKSAAQVNRGNGRRR
ncbi:hypothetical protein BGZ57DRAFT_937597 [Hyaloscypha finlandica]|nr:hypothetical protein BGZ57DRAFT_937597 [Hyaloscypha finlandica]